MKAKLCCAKNFLNYRPAIDVAEGLETRGNSIQERIGLGWLHNPVALPAAQVEANVPRVIIGHHKSSGTRPIYIPQFQPSRQFKRPKVGQSMGNPGSEIRWHDRANPPQ